MALVKTRQSDCKEKIEMTVSRWKWGRTRGLAARFFLISLIMAWALVRPSPAFGQAATGSADAPKPGYVGIATCTNEACHTKQAQAYLTGPHGRKSSDRTSEGRMNRTPAAADECESCHGPGQAHMDNPDATENEPSIAKMPAREANAVCLRCHEKGDQANFVESMHARRNVACISCHSMHSWESTKALLKTRSDADTCFTCHKSERAKSLRTSHHPVREGKMGCASCHNPHDGSRPKALRAESVNELCYTCHTEKRGPFLYEHAAVREDCLSCHEPHGSNHQRMLVSKPGFLCQQCHYSGHGLTGDFANTQVGGRPIAAASPAGAKSPTGATVVQTTLSPRQMERSCPNCHYALHGSNSPSGQFFVR